MASWPFRSTPVSTAYLGLGSNLDDRAALIEAALARLSTGGARITARSPLYETDPVTPDPQPPYLNAAARVETALDAGALLGLCLSIEHALGRIRPPGHPQAPRTIDIDILLFGDDVIERPGLSIPHPRLLVRQFARVPLADVAERGLRHPITGDRLDLATLQPSVRRWTPRPSSRHGP
jgi:2-amino-4-hydroxy-6-hydroxymethyldihydropteridine diphosphokinase